jgi:SAM-dependent methyltransferase
LLPIADGRWATVSHADAAEFWNGRYREAGDAYLFGTTPSRFLLNQRERLQPGWTALALADGEGRNGVWLAGQGLRVTATEISPVALEKAQRLAALRKVEVDFILADILRWEWPREAFDVVVAVFIQFLAPAERHLVFSRIREALRPGGLLLLHGYTPKQLDYGTGGPSAVENLYTEELLLQEFGALEIIELRAYEENLNEGSGHCGRSALIDLVARRALPAGGQR